MPPGLASSGPTRRTVLLAGVAAFVPLPGRATAVCTPRDLRRRYPTDVGQRLDVPHHEALIYASLAEACFIGHPDAAAAPQYALVVDSCPQVQAAFLYWRLMPAQWELVGASPASTGCSGRAGHVPTPPGVYAQELAPRRARAAARVYGFGVQRARKPEGGFVPLHLQARAAQGPARALLGTPQSDGCVLLPPSMVAFLDRYGVLDAAAGPNAVPGGESTPFAGRYLVVVDSERDARPAWTQP